MFQNPVNNDIMLVVRKTDFGYDFEIQTNRKIVFVSRFLFDETVHKAALCLGGAIYGYYNNDVLAEDIMKMIEDNQELLGGDKLKP